MINTRFYSALEKAREARREVALRRNLYSRKVAAGEMGEKQARRNIAIMLEIADDYEQLARQQEQLAL